MPSERWVSLHRIFEGFPLPVLSQLPDVAVKGIAIDSRKVQPGELFVALAGENADGHRYIPDALRRGAVAVVGSQPQVELGASYVQVSDSRQALGYIAAGYYGCPAHQLTIIGVTGTDGKTTTSNLIFQILKAAGRQAGMISTVNAVIGGRELDTGFHVTTPDAPDVQRYLALMVSAGLSHAVLEVTSHGLAQYRVEGCEFNVGVVTNITHEHLDYHGSYEAYREAKARLFRSLAETPDKDFPAPRTAVLNRDDSSYAYLSSITAVDQISYGLHPSAQVRAEDVSHTWQGVGFTVVGPGFRVPVHSSLTGAFNVLNCLAALATGIVVLGVEPEAAAAGVASMPGVPGRMERIDLGQDFTALVDFAHTPNALHVSLETARELADQSQPPGRVIAVFGSAGLRDRLKRRMMAEVSAELADLTVLTAEDPRTESLEEILKEMAAGAQERGGVEGQTFWRIPDRGEAVQFAVSLARPGDVVVACGKGHEQSMCFGEVEYAWDDRTAMQAALAERLNLAGPEMPYLPTRDRGVDA